MLHPPIEILFSRRLSKCHVPPTPLRKMVKSKRTKAKNPPESLHLIIVLDTYILIRMAASSEAYEHEHPPDADQSSAFARFEPASSCSKENKIKTFVSHCKRVNCVRLALLGRRISIQWQQQQQQLHPGSINLGDVDRSSVANGGAKI